jgi:hypothetical protein
MAYEQTNSMAQPWRQDNSSSMSLPGQPRPDKKKKGIADPAQMTQGGSGGAGAATGDASGVGSFVSDAKKVGGELLDNTTSSLSSAATGIGSTLSNTADNFAQKGIVGSIAQGAKDTYNNLVVPAATLSTRIGNATIDASNKVLFGQGGAGQYLPESSTSNPTPDTHPTLQPTGAPDQNSTLTVPAQPDQKVTPTIALPERGNTVSSTDGSVTRTNSGGVDTLNVPGGSVSWKSGSSARLGGGITNEADFGLSIGGQRVDRQGVPLSQSQLDTQGLSGRVGSGSTVKSLNDLSKSISYNATPRAQEMFAREAAITKERSDRYNSKVGAEQAAQENFLNSRADASVAAADRANAEEESNQQAQYLGNLDRKIASAANSGNIKLAAALSNQRKAIGAESQNAADNATRSDIAARDGNIRMAGDRLQADSQRLGYQTNLAKTLYDQQTEAAKLGQTAQLKGTDQAIEVKKAQELTVKNALDNIQAQKKDMNYNPASGTSTLRAHGIAPTINHLGTILDESQQKAFNELADKPARAQYLKSLQLGEQDVNSIMNSY